MYGANRYYDPVEQVGDESDFDAVVWAYESGDLERTASAMHHGDSIRRSSLPLTDEEVVRLRALLAKRSLELVEEGSWWGVYRSEQP